MKDVKQCVRMHRDDNEVIFVIMYSVKGFVKFKKLPGSRYLHSWFFFFSWVSGKEDRR